MISRDDDRANRPIANEITAADRLRMMGVNPEKLAGSTFPLTAPFAGTVIDDAVTDGIGSIGTSISA